MNDSKTDPLLAAQQAIAAIEWGAGSEHFRHGRETMQTDAIKAVGEMRDSNPDGRALTLDAMRLIADARRACAAEIAEALGEMVPLWSANSASMGDGIDQKRAVQAALSIGGVHP